MTQTMTQTESSLHLARHMMGAWMTQAISVAAELGIADLLADSPQTAEALAARLSLFAVILAVNPYSKVKKRERSALHEHVSFLGDSWGRLIG